MSSSLPGNPNNFIPESYIFPEDNFEEYDVKLREYLNTMAAAVNTKDSGLYDEEEVVTGKQFLPTYSTTTAGNLNYRNVYRKVVDFGALPNSGTKNVAHGINFTSDFSLVTTYGGATDPTTSFLPIPYTDVNALANNISLQIGPTNVTIQTGVNRSNYTRTFIIVEYIKVV